MNGDFQLDRNSWLVNIDYFDLEANNGTNCTTNKPLFKKPSIKWYNYKGELISELFCSDEVTLVRKLSEEDML